MKMKNKIIAFALALVIMFALIPAKITRALNKAVDENGRAIIVDQTGERIYLFKRDCKTHEWKLKRAGRCVVSEKLRKTRHYVLMRDDDYDTLLWGMEYKRWSYGMIIDCYERPESILIHSYTEKYTGRTWVKDKSRAGNDFGIAVCEELAEYIWKLLRRRDCRHGGMNMDSTQINNSNTLEALDCISRQAAIEVLRNRWLKTRNYDGIGEDIAEECEIYLKTLPSAQPERKKGKWIGKYPVTSACSECNYLIHDSKVKVFAYCPNCGADMRGEQDG